MLLAEDNPVNQLLAVKLLERRGHRVTTAANGREALERLERHSFDVVLMDIQMPEMGGSKRRPPSGLPSKARGAINGSSR